MQTVHGEAMKPKCEVQFRLDECATMPTRGTARSAGWDLCALTDITIRGGAGVTPVPTGVSVRVPAGTYGRIAMRSGLAIREHLAVTAGVIDEDYRGEIIVLAYCTKIGHEYMVKAGTRFAQLVVEHVHMGGAEQVTEWEVSAHTGFGSTGM